MKFQKFITIMQHLERLPKKQSWKFQNLKNEWNWMHLEETVVSDIRRKKIHQRNPHSLQMR